MILQMARASPLSFAEFAILSPMSKTDAHSLDPIPDEQFLETHDAAEGKPAGVRFLAFNTVIDIEAYGETAACQAAFEEARALCRRYERLFSRTLPHSDIARINSAHGQPVAIDPLTYDLLSKAIAYCAESEGAFDITVGPAVRLWNFHEGTVPDDGALAEAVRHVDWRALKLWEEGGACFAQLADPDAAVDAGGIAKGWIADALVAAMEAHGLSGTIVNLGGNVAVSGTKPTGDPWRVGIRDPRDPSQLIGAVPLVAGSAVTSGVYERCFTAPDGTFYHHILDPRTGRPVETDVAGVTVICEASTDAEGFSTTLLALGLKRGLALARRHPEILQAFFIAPDGTITNAR